MHFSVTADDIRNGQPGDCNTCAVALAIQRETGRPAAVDGYYADMEWDDGTRYASVYLPHDVRTWIDAYDNDRFVGPMEFDLDLEDSYQTRPELHRGEHDPEESEDTPI